MQDPALTQLPSFIRLRKLLVKSPIKIPLRTIKIRYPDTLQKHNNWTDYSNDSRLLNGPKLDNFIMRENFGMPFYIQNT